MILLALIALQAAPVVAANQVPSADVVVIGQKLKTWSGKIDSISRTPLRCRTTRSTGDRDIDGIGCETMTDCMSQMRERMLAVGDRRQSKEARDALRASVEHDLGKCFEERHDALVAELAERRFQARQAKRP